MSSTDRHSPGEESVKALAVALATLGEAYREQGRAFFPLAPSADTQSYFVPRPASATMRETMEAPVCRNADEFAQKLAQQWANDGLPELAALATEFARVATALREESNKRPDELSPFLYAMF